MERDARGRRVARAVAWVGVALGLATAAPAADRAWVSGEVTLNLRTGAGTQYRIVGVLRTGDAVEVLSRGEKWTQVRAENGKQGWIRAGYLEAVAPPTVRLVQLEKQVTDLSDQLGRTRSEAEELKTRNETLSTSDGEQRSEIERLTRENLELRAGARWPEWITGALILSTGMALGALLRSVSGRGRRQRIRL